MYRVDKSVAIPEPSAVRGARGGYKYPWKDLGVGDSFFVPLAEDPEGKIKNRLRISAHKQLGSGNYAVRSVKENGIIGFRVWRTG